MTPVLLQVDELKQWLKVDREDTTGDAKLYRLIVALEAALNRDAGRAADQVFAAAVTGRVETHNGTGASDLYLHYPVATLTQVAIGGVVADADVYLGSDATLLRWRAGDRRIIRVDGGLFGVADDPFVLQVTYDSQADLPADAKQALLEVATEVWNVRNAGREGLKAERLTDYSWTAADVDQAKLQNSFWAAAVENHRRVAWIG